MRYIGRLGFWVVRREIVLRGNKSYCSTWAIVFVVRSRACEGDSFGSTMHKSVFSTIRFSNIRIRFSEYFQYFGFRIPNTKFHTP